MEVRLDQVLTRVLKSSGQDADRALLLTNKETYFSTFFLSFYLISLLVRDSL